MSEPKPRQEFPKEREYNRTIENSEDIIHCRIANEPIKTRNPNVLCPFPLVDLVDEIMLRIPWQSANDLYGVVMVNIRRKWWDAYAKKDEKPKADAPPPEKAA